MSKLAEPPVESSQLCALCSQDLPKNPVMEGELGFCCPGCHAVFTILSTRQQLDNFEEHPVFQQAVRAGLISNPALLEQLRAKKVDFIEEELQTLHLEVGEMWCPSCAEIIKLLLLQEEGVKQCVVDYTTDLASVEFSPRYLSKDAIFRIIHSLGYQARSLQEARRPAVSRQLYLRLAVAAACWLNIMMFAYPLYVADFQATPSSHIRLFSYLSLAFALPVVTYSAWPIWRRFSSSLKVGLLGMETLVLIGVCTAFGLSTYQLSQGSHHIYFDSMTAIIVFVLLGKIIEARAKFSAKESLMRLTRALPRRGRKRFSDGKEAFVPLKEIVPGDHLVVCLGEKVVLDGLVLSGEGACDESLISGESVLIPKEEGDPVLGGSLLKRGNLVIQVTRSAEDSALQRIVNMVEQDLGHKSVYVRAADRVVRWFVPAVLALASLSACWVGFSGAGGEQALVRAISVLLISCPCALGIAAPLAESLLMSGLAAMGAIVRNRGCLPLLGRETRLVVDKTGTVTEGNYRVLKGLEQLTEEERRGLKSLAARSMHPVSSALNEALTDPVLELERIIEHAGRGLEGWTEGTKKQLLLLGSGPFLLSRGYSVPEEVVGSEQGSVVFFVREGMPVRRLLLGDALRPDAPEAIQALAELKPILLSGDSEQAVRQVAEACQFTEARWRCSPDNKREEVERLRASGELVCMLGDGINDAPALAAAQIGVSVVSATDMSIQVSDILLTTERLSALVQLRTLATKGRRILRQNLFWAFAYNALGMFLAAGGFLRPLYAAFAMVASSLIVVLNALRLK